MYHYCTYLCTGHQSSPNKFAPPPPLWEATEGGHTHTRQPPLPADQLTSSATSEHKYHQEGQEELQRWKQQQRALQQRQQQHKQHKQQEQHFQQYPQRQQQFLGYSAEELRSHGHAPRQTWEEHRQQDHLQYSHHPESHSPKAHQRNLLQGYPPQSPSRSPQRHRSLDRYGREQPELMSSWERKKKERDMVRFWAQEQQLK